jgi:hypothetical protein
VQQQLYTLAGKWNGKEKNNGAIFFFKEQGGERRETKINANTNEANPPEEPASPQDPTVGKGIKEEN